MLYMWFVIYTYHISNYLQCSFYSFRIYTCVHTIIFALYLRTFFSVRPYTLSNIFNITVKNNMQKYTPGNLLRYEM